MRDGSCARGHVLNATDKAPVSDRFRRASAAAHIVALEELADRAGLSARYLGSIERAAVSASVTVLGRLAQALDVDACELIRVPHRR